MTLGSRFFARDTVTVARELLGKTLTHGENAGRVTEVEAYLGGGDLAAHSARGITDRTRVIFGPPGHAYIYLIYGIHECLNLVCEPNGTPGCVLIRALEPLRGVESMRARIPGLRFAKDLCKGPGRLTRAMGITRHLNGTPLREPGIHIADDGFQPPIAVSPRIGITKCVDWLLRFYIPDDPSVSGR